MPLIAILAGLAVWMLFRAAPMWLEERIARSLRERQVVVTGLPIERISGTELVFGHGSMLYGGQSFEWETIRVEYSLEHLLGKQVDRIDIQSPLLGLNFEFQQPGSKSDTGLPITLSGQEKAPAGTRARQVEQATDISADLPGEPAGNLRGSLLELPAGLISLHDGVVNLSLQNETAFNAQFEGELARQPYGVIGELFLNSTEGSLNLSLRAPSAQPAITVQGGLAMPWNSLRTLGNFLLSEMVDCGKYPSISSSGALTLDLFAEQAFPGDITGSAEAYLDEISLLLPDGLLEVTLDELRAAGYYQKSAFHVEGGGDVLITPLQDLAVEPFGFRYSIKDSQRITLQTEVFNWAYQGVEGRCALLGNGDWTDQSASMEVSFASLVHGEISADPFSILVTHQGEQLLLEASPLGLSQSGTIWIEEVAGEMNTELSAARAGFTCYGLLGEALGAVAFNYAKNELSSEYELVLSQPDGAAALTAGIVDTQGDYQIRASGNLAAEWVNTMLKWFGQESVTLGGVAPALHAELDFKESLLSGLFDIVLAGLNLTFDSGMQVEGITGTIDGAVTILPRTTGKQVTQIARLTSGPVVIEDIRVEWELKSLRELVVYSFSGRIGQGIIELEPFSVNPLRPVFDTSVVVRHFDADLLRQWLNEKRFSIDASIAGSIPVGWQDGELVLGSGTFKLDSRNETGWLRFKDEQFLQEKFAAVGGVPKDLKERLLNALWKNGIQMNGMEVYLGPTSKSGELSFRIAVNGETASELIEFPIGGFVLNNLISLDDLATLLNMLAPVRIDPDLGRN